MQTDKHHQAWLKRLGDHFAQPVRLAPLPQAFADSSHSLYRVWLGKGVSSMQSPDFVLKRPNPAAIDQADFWQGFAAVFGSGFAQQTRNLPALYQRAQALTPLAVPKLEAVFATAQGESVSLTRFVPGQQPDVVSISALLPELARHFAAMHQTSVAAMPDWPQCVCDWLRRFFQQPAQAENLMALRAFGAQHGLGQELSAILTQAHRVLQNTSSDWGWSLPDLRWDQFLLGPSQSADEAMVLTLVDWDALTAAPIVLDWVLLEYLFRSDQARAFVAEYRLTGADLPADLHSVRWVYRLLLFSLNVLGEGSLHDWLQRPAHFDAIDKSQ
ncbi:phosphotransferase [Hydrogenovibrio halophilus]|uniref:phosphotransferase n=1 Tax=Hydrogenovibrio halophilus TaxID=373391 RepID=UPI00037CE017|nr:phosphotransferase [Hydrogenovibrio halophilus]